MTEVAKTYGDALYDLSVETGNSQTVLEETAVLAQVFKENPDYIKLLRSPNIRKDERLSVLEEAFRGRCHDHILNFMKILTENGTIGEFPGCADEFRRRYNKDHNIEEVAAVTAVPLSAELSEKLKNRLETLTSKTVLLTNRVDPSIIGGVRLEMDGLQLEGSVQHQLDAPRRQLKDTML